MTRRSRFWRLAAGLWFAINLFGGAYALVMGELPHAAIHLVLMVLGAAVWSRAEARRDARAVWSSDGTGIPAPVGDLSDRFRNLERAIDAVAIEVERIGEGQRYMTNLLVDRAAPPAPLSGPPVDDDA